MMQSTMTRLLQLEALAGQWLRSQQSPAPAIQVVYPEDGETSAAAIQRVLGRQAYAWETILLVTYEPPLPGESHGSVDAV